MEDGTFAGTERLRARNVKRDLHIHVYISYLSRPFIWKELCRYVFRSVQAKGVGRDVCRDGTLFISGLHENVSPRDDFTRDNLQNQHNIVAAKWDEVFI